MRHTRAVLRRTTATLEDSSSHVRSWGSARPFGSYLIYNIQLGWSQHINAFRTMEKSLSVVLLFVLSAPTSQAQENEPLKLIQAIVLGIHTRS